MTDTKTDTEADVLAFPEPPIVEKRTLTISEIRREGGEVTTSWDMTDGLRTTDIVEMLAGLIFTMANVEAEKHEDMNPTFFGLWVLHALHGEYDQMSLPQEGENA